MGGNHHMRERSIQITILTNRSVAISCGFVAWKEANFIEEYYDDK